MQTASQNIPDDIDDFNVNPIVEFWSSVNANGPTPPHMPHLGPCWEWTGRKYPSGYGDFHGQYTHRYSWQMTKGDIPPALWVLHKCDNPSCIRPDHLILGTPKANSQDRDRKGRGKHYDNGVIKKIV